MVWGPGTTYSMTHPPHTQMGVCEPLMPDVVAPKAHQNDHSYVSSVDLPSDSLHKNLAWWAVTRRTSKNHKTVKIGGGGGIGACPGQYGIVEGGPIFIFGRLWYWPYPGCTNM